MKIKPQELCVYCHVPVAKKPTEGQVKKAREHVPPQGLFPQGMRDQLRTVPACGPCNHRKGGSDTFLRECLVALAEEHSATAAEIFKGAHLRSFERDPRKRAEWRNRIVGHVEDSEGDLRPVLNIEGAPLRRVISDIAKCLHLSLHGRLVPPDFEFRVWPVKAEVVHQLLLRMSIPCEFIGDPRVFMFRFWAFDPEATNMLWHFEFYEGANFLVATHQTARLMFGIQESPEIVNRCAGLTKTGTRCKRKTEGRDFCYQPGDR